MRFGAPPVLAVGCEPLVRRVLTGLVQAGERVRALSPEDLAGLRLRRGQTLVLADPPGAPEQLQTMVRGLRDRVARGRGEPVRAILLHQSDPPPDWLQGLPSPDPDCPLRLESVALEDQAARALLARWPLHFGMDPAFGQRPHLLIAGFAPPARAFLLQALRLIHYGEEQARVTVACAEPESVAAGFARDYPQATQVAQIAWTDPERLGLADAPPLTQVLVALDPPETGLELARTLAGQIAALQGGSPPILVEIGDLPLDGGLIDWDGQTFPFSYLDLACAPGVLLDGRVDRLAQTIHETYTDSIAAQGRDPEREPAGRPWGQLGASYREANRHQADHLWAKLAVTDCRAVPEERVESFAFAPLEAESLAVIEHLRWAADRYLDGWSYAPARDNARKHHPQLIPYPDLSEPMKDLDRFAVRGVPNLLARSGLGVVRMLILGLGETQTGIDAATGRQPGPQSDLERLACQVVERLLARYPDRSLVVASTLADPAARLVARVALDRAGAGLFLLCPRPLPDILAEQPDETARLDLLALVARAERRIPLAGGTELEHWLCARAEIDLSFGDAAPDAPDRTEPASWDAAGKTAKRVVLDPGNGRVYWGFDY
jgi:hypothetical protein